MLVAKQFEIREVSSVHPSHVATIHLHLPQISLCTIAHNPL